MLQIVEIKIQDSCLLGRFSAQNLELRRGDVCVVQTDRGQELGLVVLAEDVPDPPESGGDGRRVIRRAGNKDFLQFQRKRAREEKALEVCRELVKKHRLDLKLTRVEYIFDGGKVIFYYTSDGRVDFRGLVKDLAATLKVRIEMRQIGVRDEARLLGGIGCCGLSLCCATWLRRFHPVSIKTAKQQCLNLNPARLSGVCGRLMCCLMYEKGLDSGERKNGDADEIVELADISDEVSP